MNTPEFDGNNEQIWEQVEREMDKRGISADQARRIATGEITTVKYPQHTERPDRPKTPHYSHRGGRAYPEPSDSETDPYWNVPTGQIDKDQAEINHLGAQMNRELGMLMAMPEFKSLNATEKDEAVQDFIAQFKAEHNF